MAEPLAYATPPGYADAEAGVRRLGSLLIVAKRPGDAVDLPPRCLVCSAPADRQWRHTLWYYRPGYFWWLLVPLYGLLPLGIAILFAHETARVTAGICHAHWASRRRRTMLGLAAMLIGIGMVVAGVTLDQSRHQTPLAYEAPVVGVFGFGLAVVGAIVAAAYSRPLRPVWIDARAVCLAGAAPAFLDGIRPVQFDAPAADGTPYVGRP